MVYDLRAYWLVYPPNLLKTGGRRADGEERAKKDRCCLNCVILGSVMRYAALLCVLTRAVTMYGSFIEARPHKSFYLVLCSDVGLCFVLCFFVLFLVRSCARAPPPVTKKTRASMLASDVERRRD